MKLGYNPLNTIPRDIVAKRCVYDAGDHYNPKIKSNTHLYSTKALPIRSLNDLPAKVKKDPSFKDLKGLKFGFFEVVGLFYTNTFDKWVLRCSCGNYEVRRAKTLKKIDVNKPDENRCQACFDCERLRHSEYFKMHGKYPWDGIRRKDKND